MHLDLYMGTVHDDIVVNSRLSDDGLILTLKMVFGKEVYGGDYLFAMKSIYDSVVFSGMRTIFDLEYPMVKIAKYGRYEYVVKYVSYRERPLKVDDFHPKSDKNLEFRKRLIKLIVVCAIFGVKCNENNVKVDVISGQPILWDIDCIGQKNPPKFKIQTLMLLFGKDLIYEVIHEMKQYDFDMDLIAGIVLLSEEYIRNVKGRRVKYKLSRGTLKIMQILQENHSVFAGENPLDLFKL